MLQDDSDPPRARGLPQFAELAGPAFTSAVLAAAPVIVLVLDEAGRIVHYNEFLERLSGRPLAEVRGRDWFDEFLIDEERAAIRGLFHQTIEAGPVHANRNYVRVRDGEPRLIEWHDRKVQGEGCARCVVAVGVDITEREAAARAQVELSRRFELFANRVDEAFFIVNATRSQVLYMSPAFERIVGISSEQIYADARLLASVLHPNDRQTFVQAFGETLLGGQVEREYRLLRPGPGNTVELRWVWVSYGLVEDPGGEPRIAGTMTDVTERKRVAQTVEDLGRTFALFDSAVDEVFLLVSPTRDRILYASASLERVFGISRSALQDDFHILLDRVHPDDRAWVSAVFEAEAIESGSAYEYRMLMRDGSVCWVMSRLRVLDASSPLPGAIVAISMDITARHDAEEWLRQLTEELEQRVADRTRRLEFERRRLQDILDGLALHVVILDPEGRVRQLNAKAAAGMNKLSVGILGEHIERLPGIMYSERSLADLRAAFAQAQRGMPARIDIETHTVVGCAVTDTSYSPIFDDAGNVVEIVSAGADVTDRRANEQQLRYSLAELAVKQGRLAAAQRIADVGDWDWNIISNHLLWSDQIYRIFGWKRDRSSITYEDFLAAVHESDRAAVMAAVDRALATGELYEVEHRIIRPDGEVRDILENGEVTRDARGQPIRMQGTAQDITRQKAVEAQLRSSLQEKDALVHELHHRVKNNLQVVTSLLYLQSLNAGPDVRGVLDECRGRIRSMALIHEHLYLSREVSRIEMRGFLAKLGEEIARAFTTHRSIGVRVLGGGMHLEIERAAPVALIVNELLTNALKYAYPTSGPGAEVRVIVGPTTLEIADDGVGLPTGFQCGNVDSLGLRLVMSLSRQLDATLEINGEKGTKIRLMLPYPNL